ncbi:MAG: zinc ribbon domain-containing protein [Coriobacteriales bacterium]|jgi:ribosomal protein L37E|nr:zinc ribbon domain-containing protein [Coriobacteriales bacterium]
MGFLDNVQDGLSRGVASTGRATKSLQLKGQINALDKKREALMGQLGASLYQETRSEPHFRSTREALYLEVEDIDSRKEVLHQELEELEREGQMSLQGKQTLVCPSCGKGLAATDAFCTGCGTSMVDIRKTLNLCAACGTPLTPDSKFCMGCGAALGA